MDDIESVQYIRETLEMSGVIATLFGRTDEGARLLLDGVTFVSRRRAARCEGEDREMFEGPTSSVQASELQTTPSNPETPHS